MAISNKKISAFLYNKEKMDQMIFHIINSIRKLKKENCDAIIWKRWQHGPHIEVVISGSKKDTDDTINALHNAIDEFFKNVDIPQTESYEYYNELSKRVAILENYQGSIFPLRKHLEIVVDTLNFNDIDTIFPIDTYINIEKLASHFICEAFPYYYNADENEKNVFLSECMIILGNQQEKTESFNGGIKYGYMTFQSHFQGFRSQIIGTKNEKLMLPLLESENRDVVEELKKDMLFLTTSETNKGLDEKAELLNLWKNTVNDMLREYEAAIRSGNVKFGDSQKMTSFFDNNKGKLSNFHQSLEKHKNYMNFLESEFFLKHRFTVNEFYKMLPVFGISPLRKHQFCKYVSDAVEEYFGQSYEEVIDKINFGYKSGKETTYNEIMA